MNPYVSLIISAMSCNFLESSLAVTMLVVFINYFYALGPFLSNMICLSVFIVVDGQNLMLPFFLAMANGWAWLQLGLGFKACYDACY